MRSPGVRRKKLLTKNPLREFVGAVSVGIVGGVPMLDLDYAEDSACDTDMNIVMTARGGYVELREGGRSSFSRAKMDALSRSERAASTS